MDNTPTPPPADDEIPRLLEFASHGGWAAVGLIVIFALVGAGMVVAILYSANFPKPTMLVLTLSIITLGLVGIYTIYGPARSDVLPLASAALGALVASLTASGRKPPDDNNPI